MKLAIATAKCSRAAGFSSLFPVQRRWIERFVGAVEGQFRPIRADDIAVKAGSAGGVAGSGTDLFDIDDERVLITIGADFDDFLDVAGSFALVPEFFAGTR